MRTLRKFIGRRRNKAQTPPPDVPVLSFSDNTLDVTSAEPVRISFSNSARLHDEHVVASSTPITAPKELPLWSTLPEGIVAAPSKLLDGFMARLGKYECIGHIKNYEHVVVAKNLDTGTYVVIKTQQAMSPRSEEAKYKSIHEAGIMRMISDSRLSVLRGHCNILTLIDHIPCFKANIHLSILEYCEGGSVLRFIKRHGKQASIEQKMGLVRDSADGLCYLHTMNITHRDFKLDNMFLKYDDIAQRYVVKIGDFGFATMTLDDTVFSHKRGSAAYAAPELLQRGQYDPFPVDVWAFGVSLYSIFECVYPFEIQGHNGMLVYGALELIISKLGELSFSTPSINLRLGPLINTIFQFNPELRPTMEMITSSAFLPSYNAPITRDMMSAFERERIAIIKKKKEAAKK